MDTDALSNSTDNEATSQQSHPRKILFPLGQIVATPGSLDLLRSKSLSPMAFIERHATGDWGCLGPEDVLENERAVKHGSRVFSSYEIAEGERLWCITEWDRSVTTLLMPSEY